MREPQLGMDSNCLSYVIQTMSSTSAPSPDDELAAQKLALIRLLFYLPGVLWVTPTVTKECACIKEIELAAVHKSFISCLFGELPITNANVISGRVSSLNEHHVGLNDCAILAEAEDVGHDVLLSYDKKFLKGLAPYSSKVTLARPADYWERLNIRHGVRLDKAPHSINPLYYCDWWRW